MILYIFQWQMEKFHLFEVIYYFSIQDQHCTTYCADTPYHQNHEYKVSQIWCNMHKPEQNSENVSRFSFDLAQKYTENTQLFRCRMKTECYFELFKRLFRFIEFIDWHQVIFDVFGHCHCPHINTKTGRDGSAYDCVHVKHCNCFQSCRKNKSLWVLPIKWKPNIEWKISNSECFYLY